MAIYPLLRLFGSPGYGYLHWRCRARLRVLGFWSCGLGVRVPDLEMQGRRPSSVNLQTKAANSRPASANPVISPCLELRLGPAEPPHLDMHAGVRPGALFSTKTPKYGFASAEKGHVASHMCRSAWGTKTVTQTLLTQSMTEFGQLCFAVWALHFRMLFAHRGGPVLD